MAAVGKLTIRAVFADETKSTFAIDNINPQSGVNPDIKFIIRNFNENAGGTLSTKLRSKNGFNWIGIDKAVYTVTDRQYIF